LNKLFKIYDLFIGASVVYYTYK